MEGRTLVVGTQEGLHATAKRLPNKVRAQVDGVAGKEGGAQGSAAGWVSG